MRGHRSPYLSHAKRALYHLSYVPVEETGSYFVMKLPSLFEVVEQSPLLHIVVILALSMRVINPCVSHMPIACPPDWHASLVGSKGAVYVRQMSLIVLSVEFMFPSTSFWVKPRRFGALISFSESSILFQMLTCQSLALPIDLPRWWGPKKLFMLDGCLWLTHQYSNVSSDVFLR